MSIKGYMDNIKVLIRYTTKYAYRTTQHSIIEQMVWYSVYSAAEYQAIIMSLDNQTDIKAETNDVQTRILFLQLIPMYSYEMNFDIYTNLLLLYIRQYIL